MTNVYPLAGQLNEEGATQRLVAAEGMPFGLIEVVMGYGGDKAAFGRGGQQGKGIKVGNELFNRAGVRYEVACDVIGAVIAHHSEVIAIELDKPEPDQAVIAAAEAAKKALRDTREALDTKDIAGIEAAIATYGPQARALYQ